VIQYVNHNQVPRILRLNWMASSIKPDITIPTCLIGAVGAGKTTAAKTFGELLKKNIHKDFRTITFHASMIESTDLGGFPHVVHYEGGGANVEYAMMKLLPFDSEEPALIIFDEIDRAPVDVQNACTELLQGGSIHGHQLSRNAYIIATMNGVSDTYTNELSGAVVNRMCIIYVESSSSKNMDPWVTWAVENDIDNRIIGFMQHETELIAHDDNFDELSFATQRSRDSLSYILKTMDKIKEDSGDDSMDIAMPVFSGVVGSHVAGKFIAYLKYFSKIPPLKDILNDPELLVSQGISTDTALFTAFISSALQQIDTNDNAVRSLKFCNYMPKELISWFVSVLEKKHPNIITSEDYTNLELK